MEDGATKDRTLGSRGGQQYECDIKIKIMKPTRIMGTQRYYYYSMVAKEMTKLHELLYSQSGFYPYLVEDDFPDCLNVFSEQLLKTLFWNRPDLCS